MNKKLALRYPREKTVFITPQDIMFCKSCEKRYTLIVLKNGKKFISIKELSKLAEMLCPRTFFKTHQSYLVNLAYVNELRGNDLLLEKNIEIPLSKRNKQDFLKRFSLI